MTNFDKVLFEFEILCSDQKGFYNLGHGENVEGSFISRSELFVDICHSINWAASSEFVSSSIPSWQILTAHAQPFRGARDLAFCLKAPLDSLLV